MSNMLSAFSTVPGEAAAALAPAIIAGAARGAIGGVALPILIELVAYSMRQQANRMKMELDRRKERK